MDTYITIKELQEKVKKQEFYSGYVIGAGYAYYVPLIIRPEKFNGSVLLDGHFTVMWVQKLDNSPEMKMKSMKEDPTKWSDFWGSTKLQRFAAENFAKQHGGTIKNQNKSDISVVYEEKLGSTSVSKEQFFHDDGTEINQGGEIRQLDRISFSNFELWLNGQSESASESILKIVAALGYSIPNSASMLLRGRSIAGTPGNCNDKVSALIDVGPGLLLWAAKATGVVANVGKGLQGYNQFLQKKPYLRGNSGLPRGTTWQQNAGKAFQTNQQSLLMNKHARDFLDEMGRVFTTIDVTTNE